MVDFLKQGLAQSSEYRAQLKRLYLQQSWSELLDQVERMFAEWQLGDPTSSTDAWRPWKRLNRSQRTRPASEGGHAPG